MNQPHWVLCRLQSHRTRLDEQQQQSNSFMRFRFRRRRTSHPVQAHQISQVHHPQFLFRWRRRRSQHHLHQCHLGTLTQLDLIRRRYGYMFLLNQNLSDTTQFSVASRREESSHRQVGPAVDGDQIMELKQVCDGNPGKVDSMSELTIWCKKELSDDETSHVQVGGDNKLSSQGLVGNERLRARTSWP